MSGPTFPTTVSKCLGQFWLPGSRNRQITGSREMQGNCVGLGVSPERTPWHTWEPLANDTFAVRTTPEAGNLVVLGSVTARPGPVSLWRPSTTPDEGAVVLAHRHAHNDDEA